MQIALQTFRLPKAGNSDAEYEDACWPDEDVEFDAPRLLRAAVADGATETLFSELWAALLTRGYCDAASHGHFLKSLPELRAAWQKEISSRPLPWYAEEKAREGAYAALAGVSLKMRHGRDRVYYQALAVGDSCLFHIRDSQLLHAFPLISAAHFNNSPYLLAANANRNTDLFDHIRTATHRANAGDTLLLLTDALAQWFLHALETGAALCDPLCDIVTQDAFRRLVEAERDAHRIRNDDTTLLRISLKRSGG